jgi:ATP-dependent RNA helicase SUPV3L1/SUV3
MQSAFRLTFAWGWPKEHVKMDMYTQKKDRMKALRTETGTRRSNKQGNRNQNTTAQKTSELRLSLLEAFPTWGHEGRPSQLVTLHLGPTNSGKTFQALSELVEAGSGWYLSPLRLLAYEVYDTLNRRGVPCSLLTGEESIPVEGASITASTIEMFDPRRSGNCVVIDEAHMLTDPQRGWAWTNAIMEARSPNIHIIGAPFIAPLVSRMVKRIGLETEKVKHARLSPLKVIQSPWSLKNLPSRTILVAFSRATVLGLKTELERRHGRSVSVVYGNLPPEVRLNQAERFASGENEICVATDAVGMGLNLPADNVCFYETEKFDGHSRRSLTPNEIRQIGGRAGRFGLSKFGQVGALTKGDLEVVAQAIKNPIREYSFASVAPTPESLKLISGSLPQKLQKWVLLQGIPAKWKKILRTVDLSQQIDLANMLSPEDVTRLGEERALKLINAPTYREIEDYWLRCARSIINEDAMPLPSNPKTSAINNAEELRMFEQAIRSADCYLWLSQREEFHRYGLQSESVRDNRSRWSVEVDNALKRKIDTGRRCPSCGRPLPIKYRHKICNGCYRSGLEHGTLDLWESN